jgi:Outer membrane protein beta-barrel domain
MIKYSILILFATFICVTINAQQVHTGVRAGLNFNQIDALGWQYKYETTPFAGIYANVSGGRLGLHVEALYTNQSITTDTSFKNLYSKYYNNILDSAKNGSFTFTKLQVPVLLNFKFSSKFWLQFGAMFSNNTSVVDKTSLIKTSDAIFKSNDVSLSGGLWVGITKRINVSGRYTQNMTDISNLKTITASNPNINLSSWKNQQVQLGIGFQLL